MGDNNENIDDEVPLEDFGGDGIDYSDSFTTSERFQSDEAAYVWAKEIALGIGFELVRASQKRNPGGPLRKYLRCNRGTPYRGNLGDLDLASRPDTTTKACKCPFFIVTMFENASGMWIITTRPGEHGKHNHSFHNYAEGHRQRSGLHDEAKKLVRNMLAAQTKPCYIHTSVTQQFPECKQTIEKIYSEIRKTKLELCDGRTISQQFLHLAVSNKYVYWTAKDHISDVLTHVFMAHPTSANLLRTYPWVILIDSTYKTNRYNMPFVEMVGVTPTNLNFLIGYALVIDETEGSYRWILTCLKNLIGIDVSPTAVVTDRELGLLRPIRQIFPNASHMLCTWHINKDVEARVSILCQKNKEMGERFKNGVWYRVIHARSVELYNQAVQEMKDSWGWKEDVIKYVEETWLNPHKEKFVEAWTNNILHFHNVNSCRVESQHASLKGWLVTSTGALDTVFNKVHCLIESQITKIKDSMEKSRGKRGRMHWGPPFQHLQCFVTRHCLTLLRMANKKRIDLRDELFTRCGCRNWTMCGIPCACSIQRAINEGRGIYLDEIHPFWKTLVISDGVDVAEFVDRCTQDVAYLRSLVDELVVHDPTIIRSIAHTIRSQLHPEDESNVEEPDTVNSTRGRPSHQSTRREPSHFEYVDRQCRSRSRSRGRSTTQTGNMQSSTHASLRITAPSAPAATFIETGTFPFPDRVPNFIRPFIEGWRDVIGDDNCGFRCVVDAFHGGEDQWVHARRAVYNEIGNKEIYERIYGSNERVEAARRRIWHMSDCAGPNHWLETPYDLYAIAQLYNCAVFFITLDLNGRSWSCTVLPY